MYDPYKALYIHVPFCKQRCGYCDFATQAIDSDDKRIDTYIEELITQIRRDSKAEKLGSIETIYIGGGTPSHIGNARLSSLLYALGMSLHLEPEVECTMEANPESLTESMIKDVWALGVNRLSIGVQSFQDDLLQTLGRPHNGRQAEDAIGMALDRFDNVSVDMICGIPGQTMEGFADDVRHAIELGVSHVSIYPLTIEEKTLFSKLIDKKKLDEPDEEIQALMMQFAESVLTDGGFNRYEVASYAKKGFECRHNMAYWTGKPYIGYGDSAVTMTQNDARRMRVQDGEVVEELNRKQMYAEDLMLSMRMTQGISAKQLREASLLLPDALSVFHELIQRGLVEHVDERYKPTVAGWMYGNELYGKIFDLAP